MSLNNYLLYFIPRGRIYIPPHVNGMKIDFTRISEKIKDLEFLWAIGLLMDNKPTIDFFLYSGIKRWKDEPHVSHKHFKDNEFVEKELPSCRLEFLFLKNEREFRMKCKNLVHYLDSAPSLDFEYDIL